MKHIECGKNSISTNSTQAANHPMASFMLLRKKMHTTKMTSSIGTSTVAALNLLGLHSFPQYGQRIQLYRAITSQ